MVPFAARIPDLGKIHHEEPRLERTLAAIVARYPREHFKEGMVQAAFDGFAHKPGTTYGTVWAGIPERFIPGYTSPNVCDLIAASPFPDSASHR
jgi:hypothetical protein